MDKHKHERSTFSGKIGFVLSAAGASVGLGNIWRFPYLAAKYGGGIFLLVYIILALTFGYTMIVAETALGRMTKKSPVGAFAKFGKSKWLSFGGCGIEMGTPEYEVERNEVMELLPKQQINIVVEAEKVDKIVDIIKKELYTGHIGDGKIFIYDIDNVIRVRTGDEGVKAL